MSSLIFTATFTIVQYNTGSSSSLSAPVKKGNVITGVNNLFTNVSGGEATVTIQYIKSDGSFFNKRESLVITKTINDPVGDSVVVPEEAAMVQILFGDVTFPAGTVCITITEE